MNELTEDLESEAAILNKWFYEKFLVFNGDKSKLIALKANRSNLEESKIQINGSTAVIVGCSSTRMGRLLINPIPLHIKLFTTYIYKHSVIHFKDHTRQHSLQN